MTTRILIIGVVRKGDSVLLRKKFAGSPPYAETWYSFGAELVPGQDPSETFTAYLRSLVGIEVQPVRRFEWDTETKKDLDGIEKQFVYLDLECAYVSGEPVVPEGLERVEWVPIERLAALDVVPPSAEMFARLGYLS